MVRTITWAGGVQSIAHQGVEDFPRADLERLLKVAPGDLKKLCRPLGGHLVQCLVREEEGDIPHQRALADLQNDLAVEEDSAAADEGGGQVRPNGCKRHKTNQVAES